MHRIAALIILAATTTSFAAPAVVKQFGTDPIVTGVSISADQKAAWKARRDAYMKCPQCKLDQPFPGDEK